MNNASLFSLPFGLVDGLVNALEARFEPPAWAVDEAQARIVLLLNHVLQQEPEAMKRLARASGKQMLFQWRRFSLALVATPAGLLDRPAGLGLAIKPDLTITLTQQTVLELAEARLQGKAPEMRIEGDVQLAAEVGWLTQHVRWDIEEDLSKILGDPAANTLVSMARQAAQGLRSFVQRPS